MNAKPLFVLIMFIMVIVLFAGGAIGSTDLTPDTPPAEAPAEQVAGINAAVQPMSAAGLSSSTCGGAYEVRSGDTLFKIAQSCGITVDDILAANPAIQDRNLISPGQQLAMPGSAPQVAAVAEEPVVAAAQEVSPQEVSPQEVAAAEQETPPGEAFAGAGSSQEVAAPQEVAGAEPPWQVLGDAPSVQDEAAQNDTAQNEPVDVLPQGLVPGGIIHVTAKSLPPTTPVSLGIGREGDTPVMVEDRITNEKGELVIHMAIPHTAKPGEQWKVSVMTMARPKTLVQSVPFTIQ